MSEVLKDIMNDIELVIKIDKDLYERISQRFKYQHISNLWLDDYSRVGVAIKNGILLPKNHGDLIDANRKITVPTYDVQYEEWGEETLMICEAINKWSDEGVTIDDIVIPANEIERKLDEKENK